MRVLVCGGRDFDDDVAVDLALREIAASHGQFIVIQGGAPGADKLARKWCQKHRISFVTVEAEWRKHGRAAGPIRNQIMVDEYKPHLVVAFPGGRGTEDMVRRATAAGIPVHRVL